MERRRGEKVSGYKFQVVPVTGSLNLCVQPDL
jgi:hypothetical protein